VNDGLKKFCGTGGEVEVPDEADDFSSERLGVRSPGTLLDRTGDRTNSGDSGRMKGEDEGLIVVGGVCSTEESVCRGDNAARISSCISCLGTPAATMARRTICSSAAILSASRDTATSNCSASMCF